MDWVDLNEKMLYRLRQDGQKLNAILQAGPEGFAIAMLGEVFITTTVPNILLSCMKRPAGAPVLKKPAAVDKKGQQNDVLNEAEDEDKAEEQRPLQKEPLLEEEEKQEKSGGAQCFEGVVFPPGWKVDYRFRHPHWNYRRCMSPAGKVYTSMKAATAALEQLE